DRASAPKVDGADGPLPLEAAIRRRSTFHALTDQLLERARSTDPALRAALEIVAVRERELLAARRAFTLPEVSAFASAEIRLGEEGAGDEPPELPFPDVGFPETPDSSWTLGVRATLPLFTGGARSARAAEAALDLAAARVLAEDAGRRAEERVRRALVDLDTAYAAAHQAQEAATAAGVAYAVVVDGYQNGAESLTTLLDAQASLRTARLSLATTRYAALTRWYQSQRAAGNFLDAEAIQALEDLLTPQPAELAR
ncbi:MAG: TolC family protein, partial [Acidobacteriota bacterium]